MNTLTAQSAKQILNGMTPAPWEVSSGQFHDGKKYLQIISDSFDVAIADICVTDGNGLAEANAIVTAANGTYGKNLDPEKYEEVVNMLQETILQIEYMQQKFGETGTGNSVLSRATTALAAARIK